MKVQSIYSSKILRKGLKFAADNGALFAAGASLLFSSLRPAIILATPNTDKKNKQYASAKSIASTLIGYALMFAASKPVAKAVENIDTHPEKYLNKKTIINLMSNEKKLLASKKYSFATQLFKLGLGVVIAAPKSLLTCAVIPPIMSKLFPDEKCERSVKVSQTKTKPEKVSFTGLYQNLTEAISLKFGKLMNTNSLQKFADKFSSTRFEQHMISLTDVLATSVFILQTNKSKKIKKENKKALIYNAAISTGLSVAGGYIIDSLTKKPTEKFIEKFKSANKNFKDIDKCVEGVRIAKPVLILGGLYYIIIPMFSTFFADKICKKNKFLT